MEGRYIRVLKRLGWCGAVAEWLGAWTSVGDGGGSNPGGEERSGEERSRVVKTRSFGVHYD